MKLVDSLLLQLWIVEKQNRAVSVVLFVTSLVAPDWNDCECISRFGNVALSWSQTVQEMEKSYQQEVVCLEFPCFGKISFIGKFW